MIQGKDKFTIQNPDESQIVFYQILQKFLGFFNKKE